jgi:tungstate transport system substrate-binding protein
MNRHGPTITARLDRRQLGLALAGTAAAIALPSTFAAAPAAAQPPPGSTVRLATVPAVQTGGLLDELLAAFTAESGYQVSVFAGGHAAVYARARAGAADIAFTHIGVAELRDFVTEGLGRWPQLVLSTSFVFIGPRDDPARIHTTNDPVTAFRRIAKRRLPFIVNNLTQPLFVTDTLWHATGRPDPQGWLIDTGLRGAAAVMAADAQRGYTIWGLHPFLMLQEQQSLDLRAVTFTDSLLQRGIASVVVNPDPERPVNLDGALALERFLLEPAIQATIRTFRHPQFEDPIFWPAAVHNGDE